MFALAQLAQNARFELEPDEDPNSKGDRVTFLAALTAQQASGKSAMKKMCDRLLLHQYQQDEEVRDTYREWDETHDLTSEPMPQLSFNSLPPDSTNAAFFQNVKRLKGKSMFVVAPEIDSFRERCSWANSGSIWRYQMSDVVIDFAIWVASYTLYQQMKFFGRQMNDSVKQNVRIMQSKGFYAKLLASVGDANSHTEPAA